MACGFRSLSTCFSRSPASFAHGQICESPALTVCHPEGHAPIRVWPGEQRGLLLMCLMRERTERSDRSQGSLGRPEELFQGCPVQAHQGCRRPMGFNDADDLCGFAPEAANIAPQSAREITSSLAGIRMIPRRTCQV
ncbi:hypothetical protein TRIUR3_19637 [Triticum urartu]|uniref:Uncharacterized protein n=1 Tax=Triticum urartu TaxID=4572 RepID=M7YL28_TRIUA|nr:hypothetical protein TRIUR3_19637 [Triticum urartu]